MEIAFSCSEMTLLCGCKHCLCLRFSFRAEVNFHISMRAIQNVIDLCERVGEKSCDVDLSSADYSAQTLDKRLNWHSIKIQATPRGEETLSGFKFVFNYSVSVNLIKMKQSFWQRR